MKKPSKSRRKNASKKLPGSKMEATVSEIGETSVKVSLEQSQAHWHVGEWEQLAASTLETVAASPQRDRIAILVACAHAQLGTNGEAKRWVRQSLKWGCEPRIAVQLLISGVYNSLGKIAALRGDEQRLRRNFKDALSVSDAQDVDFVAQARATRQMTKLGLFSEAVALISHELDATTSDYDQGRQQARIDMLRTELGLVRHELGLALTRGQIGLSQGEPSNDLVSRSVSQLGQDLWVLERTNFKRGGFFVEFGATDGVSLSNTYLLETGFNWDGLCAEPNPKFFAKLEENRRCRVSTDCISARTGDEVEFIFADAFGGFVKHIEHDHNAEKRRPYLSDPGNVVSLRTISLNDYLLKYDAPRTIDYISVDTEGSELEILSSFPFDEWDVRLWTVEHNFQAAARDGIRLLMASHGYAVQSQEWDDWFFRE